MNKKLALLLFIALLLVLLASFFASTNPDGLDKVAHKLGFMNSAHETPSVFIDYNFPFAIDPALSTALAGIIGVILLFAIFFGVRWFLKRF